MKERLEFLLMTSPMVLAMIMLNTQGKSHELSEIKRGFSELKRRVVKNEMIMEHVIKVLDRLSKTETKQEMVNLVRLLPGFSLKRANIVAKFFYEFQHE